jgi:superfamily I DNA/RNA helicase
MREMAPRTYEEMLHSLAGEEDERRCWYVGVTRAMERLTVVESKRREACPWV